jgi:hypothetical protein
MRETVMVEALMMLIIGVTIRDLFKEAARRSVGRGD